jgi:alpha-L-arabinofuranosidase
MSENNYNDALIAKYDFNDASNIGKDSSGLGNDAVVKGENPLVIKTIAGRTAVKLPGGLPGSGYLQLPSDLLNDVNDNSGMTVSTWVYFNKGDNIWERIFDFGRSQAGPYIFLNRGLRGSLFTAPGSEMLADYGKTLDLGTWFHIAFTIVGTKEGTKSSAGPILYINGEALADGSISQTSSGQYAKLRSFFDTFRVPGNYSNNYIGHSQFPVDGDFAGSLCDFRVYKKSLKERDIVDIMCESLTDEQIINLAKTRYLTFPTMILSEDIDLPTSLLDGKVSVTWLSSDSSVFDNGKIGNVSTPQGITICAVLECNGKKAEQNYNITVMPKDVAPYALTVNGKDEVLDVSDVLYGLFYEDINNAADGGIYAELLMNRSFEEFEYYTYDFASGPNGVSTGRKHKPLFGWSGDLDKVIPRNTGGLNTVFGITEPDVNEYYITVNDGAVIFNKGFSDTNNHCSIKVTAKAAYDFTIWARSLNGGTIILQLMDRFFSPLSTVATVEVEPGDTWKKYGVDELISITGTLSDMGQLTMIFKGDISIDMPSLMPRDVWGLEEEATSASAHSNYVGNPNYRLRRDLVEKMMNLHPKFLRFPGGCISEGSFIWDNVYDWKDSVGPVEVRKENFNVWGYGMTMGLGYMEYFQLAEDLNATPLPVMACGVLCQARSDYANPAGGALRQKYIDNFTDLIHFAISTDFENNKWAKIRKDMGHEAPFDLHYLGVGNENWGEEFFANFQIFKKEIDAFMEANYPGYDLTILSTVGAQADDDAYQEGWKFLSGNRPGKATIAFTDGKDSFDEDVTWYEYQDDYMETIADEHYYRANDYLLNNVDRYNYYYRNEDLTKSSKVFVGEYASSDKNTLAGAVAEAAVMTGFENNSDVVRLAAYAPLFNKVLTDSTYRWTPDCIWFDNESSWVTPSYYVQQMFAKYIGKKLHSTAFTTYHFGEQTDLIPRGGIEIATKDAEICIKTLKVIDNKTGDVLIEQDFREGISGPVQWKMIPGSAGYTIDCAQGLILKGTPENLTGLYFIDPDLTDYKVLVEAVKLSGNDGIYVGVGVTNISHDYKNAIEYAINYNGRATGVKVYKHGIEGYTLGDYSSSTCAGNLRSSCYEPLELNKPYTITVDFGGETGKSLICSYTDGTTTSHVHDYKLEAYNNIVFNSVTSDEQAYYVKLVNADSYNKLMDLNLKDMDVASTAKMITLTAPQELLHKKNVNKKEGELIVPVESAIEISGNNCTINLPANSVTVLVLNKNN